MAYITGPDECLVTIYTVSSATSYGFYLKKSCHHGSPTSEDTQQPVCLFSITGAINKSFIELTKLQAEVKGSDQAMHM